MTPPPAFVFAESAPDARLLPWVSRYWEFRVHESAPPEHRVPPDGCTSLLVASGPQRFPMLIASGPWLEPLAVPVSAGDRFVGARLQPGAAGSFLGRDPPALTNTAGPLPQLFGRPSSCLATALAGTATLAEAAARMDEAFLDTLPALAAPDPLIGAVVSALVASRGRGRIESIAQQLGVSPRTLLRRFRAAAGVSPKQYARVLRFRLAAITLLEEARLSQVAATGGYADQPHLTRESARLLGITPGQLAEIVRLTVHRDIVP